MHHKPLFLAAAVLASTALHAPEAGAVPVTRDFVSHGVANCQSALPVFDGQIRKRPKALANEGSATAFVTCDFEHSPNTLQQVFAVVVLFINRNDAPVTVSCTMVSGLGNDTFVPTVTRSVLLTPGDLSGISWSAADNGGVNLSTPAMSCGLKPGVEIAATRLVVVEDVGG
jgi:hypothetical protein